MHSPGINGEGELRGQLANPGSPGKMVVKTVCVCVHACVCVCVCVCMCAWEALVKIGCPPGFVTIIRSFHEGMRASVIDNGERSHTHAHTRTRTRTRTHTRVRTN